MTEYNPDWEITLRLSSVDWLLIPESIDSEIYETEHQGSWTKKPHREAMRGQRADRLRQLNRLIGETTGYGEM